MQHFYSGYSPIKLVNFHASAGGKKAHPESQEMEDIRSLQIQQILDSLDTKEKVLLVGDLNAGPHTSTENYQQVLQAKFTDAFHSASEGEITWDPVNPLVQFGIESHLPPQRIDHIFINGPLGTRLKPIKTEIILDETILHSPIGKIPLSDHYGVLSHMEFV